MNLPVELGVDLIKSRQIIEDLIFKVSDVESEYSQNCCITGWPNLCESRKKYIPEEKKGFHPILWLLFLCRNIHFLN